MIRKNNLDAVLKMVSLIILLTQNAVNTHYQSDLFN